MNKQDWQLRTFSLAWLRSETSAYEGPAFVWLKDIGVVPDSVQMAYVTTVKANLDGDNIPAGYLASVAYEWDSWGPSTITEFLDALEMETAGNSKRDMVSLLMAALGRTVAAEENDVTYRLALA